MLLYTCSIFTENSSAPRLAVAERSINIFVFINTNEQTRHIVDLDHDIQIFANLDLWKPKAEALSQISYDDRSLA